MSTSHTLAIFPLTEEAAWRRYLEVTRDVDADGYDDREAAAWDELQAALERLPRRSGDAA